MFGRSAAGGVYREPAEAHEVRRDDPVRAPPALNGIVVLDGGRIA